MAFIDFPSVCRLGGKLVGLGASAYLIGTHSLAFLSLSRFACVRDLLLCAKHLFIAAKTLWRGLQSSREGRDRLGPRNHLKVSVDARMLSASRTLSGCNSCRSRASRADTNRSSGWRLAPCRSRVRNSCRSPSSPTGTIGRAVSVAVVAGIAARRRVSAAAQSRRSGFSA